MSLAIGIGANTSIFSVANALLFRPLPYENPDRLVILWNRSPGLGITQDWFSTAQYFDIKNGHRGFEQVAIAIGGNYNLTGQGDPERVGVIRVSSNLLPMLGARPALGRLLTPDEDSPGVPATAILTDGMWSRRFGRDPHVDRQVHPINGQPYEIVGILPQSFSLPQEVVPLLDGTEQADIFLPLPLAPAAASLVRDHEDYNIVGKLKPGVSLTQAQAEMDTITARLRRRVSGELSAQRRTDLQHRAAARTGCRQCAPFVVGTARVCGLCAADRMCQCRQPHVVSGRGAPAGNRRPHGPGRKPMAHRPPTVD